MGITRAFSSFPDTSLFAEGSIQFSFKIRHISPDPSTLHLPEPPSPMPGSGFNIQSGPSSAPMDNSKSRLESQSGDGGGPSGARPSKGERAEEYRKWDERGREWLYGFVWFEQRRDGGIARGYMQVRWQLGVSGFTDWVRNLWLSSHIFPFQRCSLQSWTRSLQRSSSMDTRC
jgi:hypothetical protein